jgi:hypothetical protein
MANRKAARAKKSTTTNPALPEARPIIKIPASHPPSAETTNENPPTNSNSLEDHDTSLPVPSQEERAPLQPSAMTNPTTSGPTEVRSGPTQAPNPAPARKSATSSGSMQARAPNPGRAKKSTTSTPATTQEDLTVDAKLAIALGKCNTFSEVYN